MIFHERAAREHRPADPALTIAARGIPKHHQAKAQEKKGDGCMGGQGIADA